MPLDFILLNLNTVKDILEIIYYIAFIILTFLIVVYAKKTYKLQSKENYRLLCKINVQETTLSDYDFRYLLEIYNHGNMVARQIEVAVFDNHITTIDFIKPGESYMFPLGTVGQMIEFNRVWPDSGDELKKGDPILVRLTVDSQDYEFSVNTDLLFSYRGTYTGTLKDVSNQLDSVTRAIENMRRGGL